MRIKLNRLAFLFSGIRWLEFRSDGIVAQHVLGRRVTAYPASAMIKLTHMHYSGEYWDRIDLGILQLSMLSKPLAQRLVQQYQDALKSFWLQQYQADIDQVIALCQQWDQWQQQQTGYLRHHQLMALPEDWQAKIQNIPWDQFSTALPAAFEAFCYFCRDPQRWRYQYNVQWQQQQLRQYQHLFIQLEKHPLTDRQQIACVTDEQQVLVLAGAGTGKTSTLVAKCCYLLQSCHTTADKILLLAFGKDAQQELSQRLQQHEACRGIKVQTFHSLAKSIVERYHQTPLRVAEWVNNEETLSEFLQQKMRALCDERVYGNAFIQYVRHYLYPINWLLRPTTDAKKIKTFSGEWMTPCLDVLLVNGLYVEGVKFKSQRNYAKQSHYYLPQLNLALYWEEEQAPDVAHTLSLTKKLFIQQGIAYVLGLLQDYCQQAGIDFEQYCSPIPAYELYEQLWQQGYLKGLLSMCCQFIALYKGREQGMQPLSQLCGEVRSVDDVRLLGFIRLMQPLWEAYHQVLQAEGQIDFNDMLHQALQLLQQDDFHQVTEQSFQYHYLLVDEFQDISALRAALLQQLQQATTQTAIFAVGDDWQAIYRFAGSDVQLTTDFEQTFGHTERIVLDKTFRFNDQINRVASRFITHNPKQLPKQLTTHTQVQGPRVHLIKGESAVALQYALQHIQHEVGAEKIHSVLILARFYRSAPAKLESLQRQFCNLTLQFMSVHKSKGRQADFVIILDVNKGMQGFPAQRPEEPVLQCLLPKPEVFAYAEERRLLYVALTRAKHRVFVQSEADNASDFMQELTDYGAEQVTMTLL